MIVIAHLSDTHLDGSQRATDRTKAVLDHLNSLPYDLDAVLVTGDIADHGLPAEYRLARELLDTRHPLLLLPGNHDERSAFRVGLLGEEPSTGPVNQLHVGQALAVALCDSTIPGQDDGYLDDETLGWLDKALGSVEVPTLVAFHHPPVLVQVPYLDGLRQFGGERLAELTDRHPHIAGFLCGHAHLGAVTTFGGRPLAIAPGVVSTARLPWESRPHPDAHVHHDLPPALAFHVLDGTGRLTTHIRSC
ncbi:metallophosphoesterase [Kitasatospora sp. CMC57]|uniref:Metallophosphoesterase n=1 Tax=Kitasatospora sp. CMC57 TaxID=3231513 RepID=A0AB33JP31_9ACTN